MSVGTRTSRAYRSWAGPRDVMRGAALSYRALFTWLNPLGYLSSRVIRPVGMAIAFTSLSSYYGASVGRMLVGASLLAGAGAVLYGMALAVGNERSFGTLGGWLASPQNKLATACQRALPHIADGFVGGLCTYVVCCLLYGNFPLGVVAFCGLLAVGVVTTSGLGLALSALALLIEDLFVGPNAAELVLMVLSGTLVPQEHLPAFLHPLSDVLPLTHLMKLVEPGTGVGSWEPMQLWAELGIGALWFVLSSGFMLFAARRAARNTSLT